MSVAPAVAVAGVFVWLGMVLAISFLEAPLKFRAPNVTVIDAKDGSIVGTIDLGGAPEQGVSDRQGAAAIRRGSRCSP